MRNTVRNHNINKKGPKWKVDTSNGCKIMKYLVVQKQLKSSYCGMEIMRDGRRVRIVPGAGAVTTQNTDVSDCQCPSREGNRALTVKTMEKYDWRKGWGGGGQR